MNIDHLNRDEPQPFTPEQLPPDAFDAGHLAGRYDYHSDGRTETKNPHEEGTHDHVLWQSGYDGGWSLAKARATRAEAEQE